MSLLELVRDYSKKTRLLQNGQIKMFDRVLQQMQQMGI